MPLKDEAVHLVKRQTLQKERKNRYQKEKKRKETYGIMSLFQHGKPVTVTNPTLIKMLLILKSTMDLFQRCKLVYLINTFRRYSAINLIESSLPSVQKIKREQMKW